VERHLARRLATPAEPLHRRGDGLLDHRRGVCSLQLGQRPRLVRGHTLAPGLQEEQLEGLAQDRRRLRDRH
jgi:hypothetical protein